MLGLFALGRIKHTESHLLRFSVSCKYTVVTLLFTKQLRSALDGHCHSLGLRVCMWPWEFLEWQWWRATKTDHPGPDEEGLGLSAVCFWINRLFPSCSVSYLIGRGGGGGGGVYYCCLIALQPLGTRPSASGKICTCMLNKTDRAQTQTIHRPRDSLTGPRSWLSHRSQILSK